MRVPVFVIAFCTIAALSVSNAAAQFGTPPPAPPGQAGIDLPPPVVPGRPLAPVGDTTISDSRQLINNKDWLFFGHVEMQRGDTTIFADDVRVFGDTNKAIATGNVVFAQGNNRIAAERAEFDTESRLGTFFDAYGSASVRPPISQSARPGAPPLSTGQETDIYFYGDMIEKVGPRKYRITNGGFTTCVQPTPRWQLTSSTVVLNIDHYTMLKSAVFSVKGVPMLYTPILFYPTKRENRATGVLLPTYGTSTLRGQSFHNAFFWAINRSQDATFMHDWYTSTGQGLGAEYRYNYGGGTDGSFNYHWLDQKAITYTDSNGQSNTTPAERSYEIRGGANQGIAANYRARATVNYFSSIVSAQTLNTDIYDATRNTRSYGGNVIGLSNGFSVNGTFDHNEYFYPGSGGSSTSVLTGSAPRISVSRNERPIGTSDLYYSMNTEYVYLLRSNNTQTPTGTLEDSSSLGRFDINPQIRYPFKKLQWFTVNSTISWRDTYWTRSFLVNRDLSKKLVDEGLNRRFFQFQSQLVGPVFTRVWNTPENGYAEKFKHTIEPYLNLDRTTAIDNFDNIVQLEGVDYIVGGATRYTYGVNNRFYAKRRPPKDSPVQVSQAREIVDVEFSQSYYTDARAAQYDPRYQTNFVTSTAPPTNFSPMLLSVRTLPSDQINMTVRAEWDSRYLSLRTISATGTYTVNPVFSATGSWTKNGYIPEVPGFNDRNNVTQGLNGQTTLRTRDSRFGGIYSFNYDVLRGAMIQQRITGFYNAQCCGLSFEYQTYNLAGISSFALPVDRRFFMSFTLAGLGNFSPFNGALSGVPR